MSIATLLASGSITAFASSVTIPNAFTAGTTAVAADVNANFDALAVEVNDNDSRITTNTGNITANTTKADTNTGNITANTTAIGNNTTNITANTSAIGTNTTGVAANATAIGNNTTAITSNGTAITGLDTRVTANEGAITDIENGTPSCPSDMVAVGSLCVDKYEASIWDAASAGNQIDWEAAPTTCATNGSDCGTAGANPIFARSVAGVVPAQRVTWHQAVQACNNVGKRLPTAAEWSMAAAGTPEGVGDGTNGCNSAAANSIGNTGAAGVNCESTAGAADMVGNVYEWVANISPAGAGGYADTGTSTDFAGMLFGEGYDNASTPATPSPRSVVVLDGTFGGFGDNGLLTTNSRNGFRCVR